MAKRDSLKRKIYYARTYRHLAVNKIESVFYLLLLVLPCFLLLLFNYGTVTEWTCDFTMSVLGKHLPDVRLVRESGEFIPMLDAVQMVGVPTVYPSQNFVLGNLGLVFFLIWMLLHFMKQSNALSIYLILNLLVHVINCIYFLFAGRYFPYSALEFSDLYIKQQVGIWLSFLVIAGLLTGLLGKGMIIRRFLVMAFIMLYSFAVGTVRYIVFLYIIYRYSLLYMAIFFFCLGPFFDFLYLVGIYCFYLNRMIKIYDRNDRLEEWKWS